MTSKQEDTIYRIVDNRVLVLGIDEIYRKYMKEFESAFLLPQVETIVAKLGVLELDIPIEGYYGEHETLTRYFKLMRALQEVDESSEPFVRELPEFQKIWEITNSPIFGKPVRKGKLLPQGRDPLSQALDDLKDTVWSVNEILDQAYKIVSDIDDISLVGLAVRTKDPVTITALRESVILYAEKVERGFYEGSKTEYVWEVDDEFAKTANRFIEEFNNLLPKDSHIGKGIPKAEPLNIERFYYSSTENKILGRCANLGSEPSSPRLYYHWSITKQKNEFMLDEFWDTKLWTTDEYRAKQKQLGWKFLKDELAKNQSLKGRSLD